EDPGGERCSVLEPDAPNARAGHHDAGPLSQAMPIENTNAGFLNYLLEYEFRNMRLELPLDRRLVVPPDALEELARVPADYLLSTVVGPSEPTRHHAAQVIARLEQCHA